MAYALYVCSPLLLFITLSINQERELQNSNLLSSSLMYFNADSGAGQAV